MKQNIPPWLIASIVIVLVVLVGFIAKKTLFQDPNQSSVPWEETRAYKEQQRMRTQGQPAPAETPPAASNTNPATNAQPPSVHPRGAMGGGQ